MDHKHFEKNTNILKKNLKNHLQKFESLKDWPDYGSWLDKLARMLDENPTPVIPESLVLAKRLGQCLHPTFQLGNHKAALRVYAILFKSLRLGHDWMKEIPPFCIGLFPFFQYCSIQIKPEFIKLIQVNLLDGGPELIPMLPGLITSLLPGLDEQDESLQKMVIRTFQGLTSSVGQKFFIGHIWLSILKNPKVRGAGIKYLSREMKARLQLQQGEGDNEAYQKYHQKALGNVMTARTKEWGGQPDPETFALHENLLIDIENSVQNIEIYFPEGKVLVNTCLACLEDEQVAVRRAILDLIEPYLPLNSDAYLSKDEKLAIVEGAVKLQEKKDISINRRVYKWLFGGDVDNEIVINDENKDNFELYIQAINLLFTEKINSKSDILLPFKIIMNIFIEHDELTEPILNKITTPLILFCYDKVQKYTDHHDASSQELLTELNTQTAKLFNSLSNYMSLILTRFVEEILLMYSPLESLKRLQFLINSFLENNSTEPRKKAAALRIAAISILSQAEHIHFQGEATNIDEDQLEFFSISAKAVREYLAQLSALAKDSSITQRECLGDEAFVAHLVTHTEALTEMLRSLKESLPSPDKLLLFRPFITDSLRLLIIGYGYTQNLQPLEEGKLPEWLMQICYLLQMKPIHIWDVCLIELLEILDLGLTKEGQLQQDQPTEDEGHVINIGIDHSVWGRIRNVLTSDNLRDVLDFKIINKMAILVWEYFTDKRTSTETVNLVLKFLQNCPHELISHIMLLLKNTSIESSDEAFRTVSRFWSLTQKTPDKYMREFRFELVGVMCSFLDSSSPLHRFSAKNWLYSIANLKTVLIPLFRRLFFSVELQYRPDIFYLAEYDVEVVELAFKGLKDILITMGEDIIQYMYKTTIDTDEFMKYLFDKSSVVNTSALLLIDVLSLVSLRFIEGRCDGSQSDEFIRKNTSIKSVACEFLEMVLKRIDNQGLTIQICFFLMQPIVKVLRIALDKGETSILIQLISLLRVIMFDSGIYKLKQKDDPSDKKTKFIEFMQTELFMGTILDGLKGKLLYVLREFKNFLNTTVSILSDLLRHPNLTQLVRRMLHVYYQLIASKGETEAAVKGGETDEETLNEACLIELIEGLEFTLQIFVGSDNITEEEVTDESIFNVFKLGFVFNTQKRDDKFFKKHEDVGKAIINDMSIQLDAFSSCWSQGKKYGKIADFGLGGCPLFSFESIKEYTAFSYNDRTTEINEKIVNIIRPFGKRFMSNLVAEFLQYWIIAYEKPESAHKLRIIIEIISESKLNPVEFLASLSSIEAVKQISKENTGIRKKLNKGKKVELRINQANREVRMLYFIYNYLKFLKLDYGKDPTVRKQIYKSIWEATCVVLDIFADSESIFTAGWILEIMEVLSVKFGTGEVLADAYSCYFKVLIKSLSFLSGFSSGKIQLGLSSLIEAKCEVTPFTPQIYEMVQEFKECGENLVNVQSPLKQRMLTTDFRYEVDCLYKYQLQSFKWISKLVTTPIFSVTEYTRTDRLLAIIHSFSGDLFSSMYTKLYERLSLVEAATEVLHNMFLPRPHQEILRDLKKDILEVFNLDNFFQCSQTTLIYWTRIINHTAVHGKEDLLGKYLSQVNFTSLFKSKSNEDKTRIKSFERVCFVIYSGEIDQYLTRKTINTLMERIVEVIKNDKTHPSLQILILFCIRILVIRISSLSLNELFRSIWPVLLTLLIKIFDRNNMDPEQMQKKDVLVVLAGMKLLELLSVCNVEEFNLYQWMFVFDYFGITLESSSDSNGFLTAPMKSPLWFKPYLTSCLPGGLMVNYLKNSFATEKVKSTKKEKRRILIVQNSMENGHELQAKAQEFLTYLVMLNQGRVYTDQEDIEDLIQQDFINMYSTLI